jgi:hypothetical protein
LNLRIAHWGEVEASSYLNRGWNTRNRQLSTAEKKARIWVSLNSAPQTTQESTQNIPKAH